MSATQTTRGDLSQATLGWKIRQRVLVYQLGSDLMFALISTEELEDLNQICVKQLKNRYNDPTVNKRFILGIDRAKMSCMMLNKKHKRTW